MQLPITIGLRRSFLGPRLLGGAHGLAALAILFTPWPVEVRSVALVALAAAGWIAWRRLQAPMVKALQLLPDGRLRCRPAGGDGFVEAEVLPGATVHPWLAVVRLQLDGKRETVVVFPDSADQEEFRRLRVWLRWRADFSGGMGGA